MKKKESDSETQVGGNSTFTPNQPRNYQIRVSGRLDESWSDWLEATITIEDVDTNPITSMTVKGADQSILRGILDRLLDLNFLVLSVNQIE